MKKAISVMLAALLVVMAMAGCAAEGRDITVISREEGSGTRGAFIELFGIEKKDNTGEKIDYTIETAVVNNSTGVVLQSVVHNTSAIGYISLGSLNDTVKALKIDGVEATVENIKNGAYKIARPFNIATMGSVSDAAQDFINYILSSNGQAVIEDKGYIPASNAGAYSGTEVSGEITVAGSSSVSPVMEKLIEAYNVINPDVDIELQTSDSTTGMNGVVDGVCDIGMASRELKDSELDAGLTPTVIAMDGIAVIVNNDNAIDGMTSVQVNEIYTGVTKDWSELE